MTLKTGDRVTIDFTRGGWRAGITVDGRTDLIVKRAKLDMRPGQPTTLTLTIVESMPKQVGYFVGEEDMGEFLAWRLARNRAR